MNYIRLVSNILSCSSRPSLSCAVAVPRSYTFLQARLKCGKSESFRFHSSSPSTRHRNGEGPPKKLSLFQKFKAMYRDYWYVLVPVHVVTSLGWIGGFYYIVSSGLDVGLYMRKMGFSDSWVDKVTRSGAGNLAVAYALYKIATPARYTVTLGGTTLAINKLKNMGYIRPAKEIYSANKEKFQNFQRKRVVKRMGKSKKRRDESS